MPNQDLYTLSDIQTGLDGYLFSLKTHTIEQRLDQVLNILTYINVARMLRLEEEETIQ